MPVAATTDIEIAQRACIMAGIEKISTFADPASEVSLALDDVYEDIVQDALSIHPWRFANFDVELGPQLTIAPLVEFNAAYSIPAAPRPIQVRTLYVGGTLTPKYRIMGNQLWVQAQATDSVVLDALWRMGENHWPPWFTLYAILRIAGFLTGAITRNGQLAAALLGEAEKQLVRSRTRDSQQQTTQKLRMTRIRSTRLGGRPM